MKPNCIVILGPTASGKTALAAKLAHALQTEIISADSRQVYKELNIGTGKDLEEYWVNEKRINTHLIDIKEAGDAYHVNEFKEDFFNAFQLISLQHKLPIICGGSAMYIDSVLRNFEYTAVPINEALRANLYSQTKDQLLATFREMPITPFTSKADITSTKRLIRAIEINEYLLNNTFKAQTYPILNPVVFGLDLPIDIRRQKISERLMDRLQHGLIEEVEQLLTKLDPEKLIYYGLEYKFITNYLIGKTTYDKMVSHLTIAIQQFAKRQMTYFRKMEREGLIIHWIDASRSSSEQLSEVQNILYSHV